MGYTIHAVDDDDESCEEYCQRVGAEGCGMDASNMTHSGTHSCTCPSGYVWNATHCESEIVHET